MRKSKKTEEEEAQRLWEENPDIEGCLGMLVNAANKDSRCVPALKKFIAEHPGIYDHVSIVGGLTTKLLIWKICGNESKDGAIISLNHEHNAVIRSLATDEDGPVEKLMIERIGLCWLRVLYAEVATIQLMGNSRTLKLLDLADRQLERAQRRYTKACESLTRIRAMTAVARAARAEARLAEAKAAGELPESKPALRLASSNT